MLFIIINLYDTDQYKKIQFHLLRLIITNDQLILYKFDLKLQFEQMFRNTHSNFNPRNNYSSGSLNKQYTKKSSVFGGTGTNFNAQRSPLYPIGPVLTQPAFKPMNKSFIPSPYLQHPNVKPSSYEQKYLRTQPGNNKLSIEDREKRLINRNEHQIQQQHKKNQQMKISFEREIERVNKNLIKNMEKKQKLMNQVQKLESVHSELHEQLMTLQPPKMKIDTFEPLDRKQQQMIIMKNKLVTKMREKQAELNKQQQEQQKYWEDQINQKQRILLNLEQQSKNKRIQIFKHRQLIEKPDLISIENEVRQEKYEDFLQKAQQIDRKVKRYTDQRQKLLRQVTENLVLKKPQLHNQRVKHEQIHRQVVRARLRLQELERVGKQMQIANQNLMSELNRKQSMINRYQLDIHELKEKKQLQERQFMEITSKSLQKNQKIEFLPDLDQEVNRIQQEIRQANSENQKLKYNYQKLYQLLCSATSKNLRSVFNDTIMA